MVPPGAGRERPVFGLMQNAFDIERGVYRGTSVR
jgi:hypothetical protein